MVYFLVDRLIEAQDMYDGSRTISLTWNAVPGIDLPGCSAVTKWTPIYVEVTYLPNPLIPLAPRDRHVKRSFSMGSFVVWSCFLLFSTSSRFPLFVAAIFKSQVWPRWTLVCLRAVRVCTSDTLWLDTRQWLNSYIQPEDVKINSPGACQWARFDASQTQSHLGCIDPGPDSRCLFVAIATAGELASVNPDLWPSYIHHREKEVIISTGLTGQIGCEQHDERD